jgi:hypothetical protein
MTACSARLCGTLIRAVPTLSSLAVAEFGTDLAFERCQQPARRAYDAVMCSLILQVRQKTVYLQYSTRQEIGNSGPGGGGGGGGDHSAGPVILIIMDNLNVSPLHILLSSSSSSSSSIESVS